MAAGVAEGDRAVSVRKTKQDQLELFSTPRRSHQPGTAPWDASVEELARRLPDNIRLGTSSWTFPGWSGLCYPEGTTSSELLDEGLRLYTRYPLFRAAGIDRSFYKPIGATELAAYRAQLPPNFTCTEKVWDRLVLPRFPHHPRFATQAGRENPDFLDAALFASAVHAAHEESGFLPHLCCYVLEFPPIAGALNVEALLDRLDRFLTAAPLGVRFAVELRNRPLLTSRYLRILEKHGAAHVYNWWTAMPELRDQRAVAPPTADFMVSRLLLRPGTDYTQRKADFAPFDRLVDPSDAMRDDVTRLAEEALSSRRTLTVIVNNKAEGSSPLTVKALAERIAAISPPATPDSDGPALQ